MGSGWAKLGIAVGGAMLGGWMLAPMLGAQLGLSIGMLAGSYLGSMIFPTDYETEMPPVHDYPIQNGASGIPIPIVYGTVRLAGNVIWMSDLVAYQIEHSAGGGGKGGGDEQVSYETKYRRSFLIAICEGPAHIIRAWRGKKRIGVLSFTSFNGYNNSGISTLIGEDYAEYDNMCLAYFEDYELGNSQAIPNFVFEVSNIAGLQLFTMESDITHVTDFNGKAIRTHTGNDVVGDIKVNDQYYFTTYGSTVKAYNLSDGSFFKEYGLGRTVSAIAFDPDGIHLYAGTMGAVLYPHNSTLGKFVISTGALVWSKEYFNDSIRDIEFDSWGNLYVAGNGPGVGLVKADKSNGDTLVTYSSNDIYAISIDGAYAYCTGHATAGKNLWRYRLDIPFLASDGFTGGLNGNDIVVHDGCVFVVGTNSGGKNVFKYSLNFKHLLASFRTSNTYAPKSIEVVQGDICVGNKPDMDEDGHIANIRFFEPTFLTVNEYLTIGSSYIIAIADSYTHEDTNFASMIKDLLTNERYGNYKTTDLITADFDSIIAYCETNDLRGSLAITQQKPLSDWIAYICSHFQGYFYEIGGKVGLNCYRSQASVLSISQDDLVRDGDEPPVHTTKRPYSSTFNRLESTWTDRDNNYKTAVVPAFDRIDQRESGQVRTKTMDLKAITDDELASKMAWRIFIDQIYRFSQYAFKLGYKSMLLEVGDVIDVTDGHLLVAQKMRVMSISEEKDGRRALITAVEDITDFYPAIDYPIQQSEATLDADITLTDGALAFREDRNDNKLYLSITPGGTQCNGFYIYRSYDDASYDLVGKSAIGNVTGGEANSTGTIQSNLPAYTAVVHRKDDAFDVSIGTITDLNTAITDDDFFNNRKLARVGSEIIAYRDCVESATAGIWRVSNLIRGLFGTEPVAHVPGEVFHTLDVSLIYALKESDVGRTLYFKVVSFYAKEIQLKSEVSSQSHVISGKYVKLLPVSLMRIEGRKGLSTYRTNDVDIDWYFCSKISGFGRGGYGNALWGAYKKDPLLKQLKVELEEEDGTPIIDADFELGDYGEPTQLEILEADRNGKNPVRVKITPGSHLWSDETRNILIERI